MALVVKDRVKETTSTTGTGTLTLAGAVNKFQSFSVVGNGNTTYYAIESGNGTDWEIGVGTYTASGTTLSRDTILESSNGGSAISLTGVSIVFCTYPAERSVNTADIGSTIQAYDADTVKYDDATANFTGNLQKSGANVLTGNQTITLSGDVTGSGTTAITTTVGNDSHSHTTSTLSGNVSAFTNDSGYITGNQTITLSGDLSGSGTTSINAQLGANVVNANELNVTGNGTTSQYLRSDGDGTFTWATPPDTTANQTITLSGDATGSGTTAITVTVADNSHNHTSANISDATSANTANTIVERDVSGNFSAGTITAALSGNATSATTATTATNATNATITTSATASAFKVPFANTTVSTTGNYGLLQDSTATFTYNPSTNTLTAGTFSGALSGNVTGNVTGSSGSCTGNASTATTLQTARTINGVSFNGSANIVAEPYVEDDEATNATRLLTFVDNSTAGYKRLNEDSTLTYNPSTNTLTAGTFSGALSGNATTATKWATGRTISLTGDVTGTSASFDGSGNASITATVVDDSHNHIISNVDGLQTALDAKAPIASPTFTGTATTPNLQITSGALVRDVTGEYGSIEIDNGATGGYEGFSIGGRAVFMHNNDTTTGIYNDVNNHWIMRGVHGGLTSLYFNGAEKLQTTNTGVTVTGTCTATSFSGDGSALTGISVTPTAVSGQANSATSYFDLPAGTTAQRPGSPNAGMIRFNTTTNEPEWYDSDNGKWFSFRIDPTQYSSDYLIVAGGGGGGGATRGGGGGAGGMLTGTTILIRGTTYNITVGSGGASGAYSTDAATNNKGTQGVNSTALGLTAIGGGFGQSGLNFGTGGSGGSGGGAGAGSGASSGGAGTAGQGNKGGDGGATAPYFGGGGGAGAVGGNFNSGSGGYGGNGLQSSITGTATYYAGGGSASNFQANSGYSAGLGGGGVGRNAIGTTVGIAPSNGTANTGGGGGASGNGGSGVVIFRVLTSDYSGTTTGSPTVTTDGSYTVIKFTASGSYTA